ncbi:MAG: TIGR04255 family protein [Candidatus Obscuribacterales bacterium]|jgi:uncharacterized protein (TIGR04255 family)
MQHLHFKNAPITEAVIEIRVETPAGVSLPDLATNLDLNDYPARKNRIELEGMFEFGEETSSAKTAQKHTGYIYTHSSGKQILQVSDNTFSLSRLAPYGSWNEFSTEARRLWDAYNKAVSPTKISRIALRYINRIDIPLPVTDLKDYLRTYPEMSAAMSQGLSGYFMRLENVQPDIRAALVLHQAMVPPPNPEVASILLDIDLFRDEQLANDVEAIWQGLEELRRKKNEIFLGCLTENTLRLFDK